MPRRPQLKLCRSKTQKGLFQNVDPAACERGGCGPYFSVLKEVAPIRAIKSLAEQRHRFKSHR